MSKDAQTQKSIGSNFFLVNKNDVIIKNREIA